MLKHDKKELIDIDAPILQEIIGEDTIKPNQFESTTPPTSNETVLHDVDEDDDENVKLKSNMLNVKSNMLNEGPIDEVTVEINTIKPMLYDSKKPSTSNDTVRLSDDNSDDNSDDGGDEQDESRDTFTTTMPLSPTFSQASEMQSRASMGVTDRESHLGDLLPRRESIRDSIRSMHAHALRDCPSTVDLTATTSVGRHTYCLTLNQHVLSWGKIAKKSGQLKEKGAIDTDDIVGAVVMGSCGTLVVHTFAMGKTHKKARHKTKHLVKRTYRKQEFHFVSGRVAQEWAVSLSDLVKWQARVPEDTTRRVKVVVNPHSGKNQAEVIWRTKVKPLFDVSHIEYDMEETTYGGHAIAMGKEFDPSKGYEALVFISGDGTIAEYMNGLLSRPEREWQKVLISTPLSLISAGTQNAFGKGLGIPTYEAAVYSIIKRKIRPMDVLTATAMGLDGVSYSNCGLGWGTPGEIAEASEKYRWMGTKRYGFLKLKFGLFPPKHSGTLKYIPAHPLDATTPVPPLKTFDELRNDHLALDQHDVEFGSPYDTGRVSPRPKTKARSESVSHWTSGKLAALRDPANPSRFRDDEWVVETGHYIGIGVLNTVPDGKYCHPSDGNIDLVIARKGNLFQKLQLGLLYLCNRELKSSLMSYVKVKAVILEQNETQHVMNLDGEVFPGPGPWHIEVVPSLFKVLSEK